MEVNAGDAFAQGIIMGYEITDDDEVTDKRTGGIGSTSKPQKFDMSKKCGLEYFNKWGDRREEIISCAAYSSPPWQFNVVISTNTQYAISCATIAFYSFVIFILRYFFKLVHYTALQM